jgi:Leucine-rich repeat (LRR) protein
MVAAAVLCAACTAHSDEVLFADIVVIENLERLSCLQKLNLSNNRVEQLDNLSHLRKLKFLGLANNRM